MSATNRGDRLLRYKPALGQLKKAFDELEQIESCDGEKEHEGDPDHGYDPTCVLCEFNEEPHEH